MLLNMVLSQVREANQMVEEMMLLANCTVAEQILAHFPACALLRNHAVPPPRQFEPLLRAAAACGIVLEVSSSKARLLPFIHLLPFITVWVRGVGVVDPIPSALKEGIGSPSWIQQPPPFSPCSHPVKSSPCCKPPPPQRSTSRGLKAPWHALRLGGSSTFSMYD